jgi:hypothetical protein
MTLHAATRAKLEPWFQMRRLGDQVGTVDLLTEFYVDAWQFGYRFTVEDLRTWATAQGWSAADADHLCEMARIVHRAQLHAGRIAR